MNIIISRNNRYTAKLGYSRCQYSVVFGWCKAMAIDLHWFSIIITYGRPYRTTHRL
jgi:hypothetical protein